MATSELTDLERLAQHPAKLEQHISNAVETTLTVITTYGLKVIGAIIIAIAGWVVSGILQNAILRAGRRSPKVDITIFTFIASLVRYTVLIFTVVAMLSSFGVETTSFVAVLGAAGLAVGLALQGTLSHVASGFMLIVFRPFRVGDQIEAAGVAGVVQSITLFVTEIDTADNVRVIVPNGLVWSRDIKNFSTNGNRKIDLKFQISHSDDVDKVIGLLRDILNSDVRVQKNPAPVVGVQTMSGDGVVMVASFWVEREAFAAVPLDINKEVKTAFTKAGITMAVIPRFLATKP